MSTASITSAIDAPAAEEDNDGRLLSAIALSSDYDSATKPEKRASLSSCVSNLANTILGAGMLGLPHAFAMAGFVPGFLMLLIFGAFSSLGLHLLSEAADRAGRPASFYGVAEAALPGAGVAIDIAIGVKCFGVATSYLIVIGDSMPKALSAFGATGAALNRRLWTLTAALVVAPLTYLRRIDGLKFTSTVALVCVLFVVLLVFLFATRVSPEFESCNPSPPALPPMLPPLPPLSPPKPPSAPPLPPTSPPCRLPTVASAPILSVLEAVPIFVFSYTCHQNIISITNELLLPTPSRTNRLIATSVLAALAVYLLISLSGYLTFGPVVASDVLATYPSSALVAIARLAISIVVTFSYPLQSHPSRGCIISLITRARKRFGSLPPTSAGADGTPSLFLHVIVTTAFLVFSTAIALSVDDLGVVLSFVGATGSTIVSYILPGGTYYLLCRKEERSGVIGAGGGKWRIGLLQLGLGCVLMPLSLTLIVVKLARQ